MSLADVVHRIASDPSFASRFAQDPATALASAKLELSEQELAALRALMARPKWETLCSPAQAEIDSFPWLVVDLAPPQAYSPI